MSYPSRTVPLGILSVFLWCALCGWAVADDEGRPVAEIEDRPVSFQDDILPILQRNCLACHNESETEGELILESPEAISDGGDSGPAIVAGNAEESLVFQLAAHRTEPFMPPVDNDVGAKPLSPQQLALVKLWIDQGAKEDEEVERKQIEWRLLPKSYAPVVALEVSPDGNWLAAGRGQQLVMYSVAGKREVQRLVDTSIAETHPDCAHLGIVQAVAFSPDRRTLVSGGFRNFKVWRRSTAATPDSTEMSAGLKAYLAKAGSKPQADFVAQDVSADGKFLVTVESVESGTKTQLFSLPERKLIAEIPETAFDGHAIATTSRSVGLGKERLRVAKEDVDVAKKRKEDDEKNSKKSDEELKKAKEEVPKRKEAFDKAAEDTKKKAETQKQQAAVVADQVAELKTIAEQLESASDAEKKSLVDQQKKLKELLSKSEEKQGKAKKTLDTATKNEGKKKQELEGAEKVVQLAIESKTRAEKAVERRGEELAAAEQEASGYEEKLKLAETALADAKQAATKEQHAVRRVAFLGDGWQFALWDDAGQVAQFVAETGQQIGLSDSENSEVLSQWKLVETVGSPDDDSVFADRVTSLAFSHNGAWLAVGGGEPSRSGDVQLWDTSNWTQTSAIENVHSDVVYDLQFSLQDNLLASCASDRMMKVIDPAAGKLVRSFEGHTGHVLGVAWRADGRTLATAGADKVVKVWDAKEGTQKKTVSGFKTEVTAIRYLGLEDRFVFSVGDGKVESRDSKGGGKPGFKGFSDYVHRVSASQAGDIVAAAGQDRVIRVWDEKGKQIVEFK